MHEEPRSRSHREAFGDQRFQFDQHGQQTTNQGANVDLLQER